MNWAGYQPSKMTNAHLYNAYASLKRRTYRDGNHTVFIRNCDVLDTLRLEMNKRKLEIPNVPFATGWIFAQIFNEEHGHWSEEYSPDYI